MDKMIMGVRLPHKRVSNMTTFLRFCLVGEIF
jgi:hypothetical protein